MVSGRPALAEDDSGSLKDFEAYPRPRWIELGRRAGDERESTAMARAVAIGEPIDPDEVLDVYVPLARWIADRVAPGPGPRSTTAVIGITGSVAVGKSTTARVLRGLLERAPSRPTVDLLATDGFLLPNQALVERGILDRKGFPESYDHRAMVSALEAICDGQEVTVPVYSHRDYDIVPGAVQRIRPPELLVVEGLTVLQGAPGGRTDEETGFRSLIDLGVYVDAAEEDVAHWHIERLAGLRTDGSDEPGDFQRWYSSLSEMDAQRVAASSWSEINLVNLRRHVAPTRPRSDVIIQKGADHRVLRVLLRRGADHPAQGRTGSVGHPIRSTPSRTNSELRSGPQISVRIPRAN
jgi:type I pantothenate kinase